MRLPNAVYTSIAYCLCFIGYPIRTRRGPSTSRSTTSGGRKRRTAARNARGLSSKGALIDRYWRLFDRHVAELLGGLDMADDFFRMHPRLARTMRVQMMIHFKKGGAAWKGAAIFFRRIVKPQLAADRKAAMRTPNVNDTTDPSD